MFPLLVAGALGAIAFIEAQSYESKMERVYNDFLEGKLSEDDFMDKIASIYDSLDSDDSYSEIPSDIAEAFRSEELTQYKLDNLFRSGSMPYIEYKILSDMYLYGDWNS